jgi:hypothetical protein
VSSDGKGIPGLVATLAAVALGLLWLSPQQISAAEDAAGTELPPTPVQTLFKRLPVELDGWTAEGSEGAIALQMFPFAGREDLVARFKTNRASRPSCAPTDDAPLETIAQHARQAQIVIINEAHHQPFHRYVIQQLGVELADEFSVFAAETLITSRWRQEPSDRSPMRWAAIPMSRSSAVNSVRSRMRATASSPTRFVSTNYRPRTPPESIE